MLKRPTAGRPIEEFLPLRHTSVFGHRASSCSAVAQSAASACECVRHGPQLASCKGAGLRQFVSTPHRAAAAAAKEALRQAVLQHMAIIDQQFLIIQ